MLHLGVLDTERSTGARERYDDIIVQGISAAYVIMGEAQKPRPGSPRAVLGRGDHSEVPEFS